MTVHKCDRCGEIYIGNEGKQYILEVINGLTFDFLDLCPACQNELKEWVENPNTSYTEE